ncbi:PepSY domain-containing protein [Kitasatospora sp. NPDC048365]|uniref:PepSY domain-containing protein n=1 Tax=Kitasatospora sp. NPDC048365 TaxID=3364050 RepID=UPI0037211161
MSEANGPEPVETAGEEPVAAKPSGRRGFVWLPRRRWARWTAGAAAAVVLGALAGTTVVVAAHHDGMRVRAFEGEGKPFPPLPGGVFRGPNGEVRALKGGPEGYRVDGDGPAVPVAPGLPGFVVEGRGTAQGGGKLAPAPLPSVAADQALAKAVAAVPGGKAAGLTVVGREGGGSSWLVEVLGSDGVRHLVTVDGTDGSVTGNTVADGR